MWGGQLNPRFWGSLGATQQAPLCVGKEGAKRQEGGLPGALAPHPSPTPFQACPSHWASGGLQLPSPIPGSTPSLLKQAKHRRGCLRAGGCGGGSKSMTLGRRAPPSPPLLVEPPLLARPAAATPCCGACYPSSHLLEILWVAEFLDSDREEVAGDVGDDHVGAG